MPRRCASLLALALVGLILPAGAFAEIVQREGTVRIRHADDFANGVGQIEVSLDTGSELISVIAGARADELQNGDEVRLIGDLRADRLSLARNGTVEVLAQAPRAQDLPLSGRDERYHRTLVIIATRPGVTPTVTPAQTEAVMFGPTGSLDAYYREQTSDRLTFAGDVAGPFTLSGQDGTGCPADAWETPARAAATAAGNDVAGYDEFIYVFFGLQGCGFAGRAWVGGPGTQLNGTIDLRVVAHEVGHNLGAWHAATLACTGAGGVPVAISASCSQQSEYGDPFDVMGSTLRQMNAPHHVEASLWPGDAVAEASHTGSYRILPLESATGVRSLRIKRFQTGAGAGSYYVELRRPLGGFDSAWGTSSSINGVLLHLDRLDANGDGSVEQPHTQLVNTTASGNPSSAVLMLGQTFVDQANGITITLTGLDATGADVSVTYATEPPADTAPPSSPFGVHVLSTDQTHATLAWYDAYDNVGVHHYRVQANGVDVATSGYPDGTIGSLAPATAYSFRVIAVDAAGNASAPSGAVSATTPGTPDTSAPTSPLGVTATVAPDRSVTVQWLAASDDVGVARYRVLRDGVAIGEPAATTLTDAGTAPATTYRYRVLAVDASGNVSVASAEALATTPALAPGTSPPVAGTPGTKAGPASPPRSNGRGAATRLSLQSARARLATSHGRRTVRVRARASDVSASCSFRLGRGPWRTCKVRAGGTIAITLRVRAKRAPRSITLRLARTDGATTRKTVRVS